MTNKSTSKVRTAKKMSIQTITLIGVMTAVTCILGPLSLPVGPVPISFTNLAIYLTIILLGTKRGTISYLVYLLIGLIGLPIFSNFTGGPGKLLGPTGGYLIGFIFMALITGFFVEKYNGKIYMYVVGMVIGTIVAYCFGTMWLAYQAKLNFAAALLAGVVPFIIGDLAKIMIAALIGPIIKKRLLKAGLGYLV